MDVETMEESLRSSVSSLKSRFEQLATKEVKNGPDDKAQSPSLGLRLSSQETLSGLDEQKSRSSFEGIRSIWQ